jgi:hypothetical protein
VAQAFFFVPRERVPSPHFHNSRVGIPACLGNDTRNGS